MKTIAESITKRATSRVPVSPLRAALASVILVAASPLLLGQSEDAILKKPLLGLSIKELGELTVDTVFAASKFSQKISDAPSSVSIVTRNDIRQFGYRTLSDVVRSVPGYDVTYDRAYSYTGVRGFNSLGDFGSRVLLLVDGHRMNDALYDSAPVGTEALLDVDLIERVEFVRGPGSAVFGSNAFSGVINVITRSGRDIQGAEASASGGSFGTYSGRMTIGQQLESGFEYLFSASTYSSDGPTRLFYKEFASSLTNRGIALNQDADQFWSAFGKVGFGDFTLEGGYVTGDKNVPTASYDSDFNSPHPQLDDRGFVELRYAHEFDDGWSANGRLFYDHYDYEEGTILSRRQLYDSAQATWWGLELGGHRTFWEQLLVSAGIEWRDSLTLHQQQCEEGPHHTTLDIFSELQVLGVYLEGDWKISDSLSLIGGFRWDHYNSFGNSLTPRTAVVWRPSNETSVKLLYGEAFRAPNPFQLSYKDSFQDPNPGLQPEKTQSCEIMVDHALNDRWNGSVSVFHDGIRGLINAMKTPGGRYRFENVDEVEVDGLETQISGKWDNGVQLKASYTRQNALDGETDAWLVNSPKNMIKAQMSVPLGSDKLSGGLELLYASQRATLGADRTPDAWMLNFTLLSRQLAPGLDLSLSVYNVLGSDISFPGGSEHRQDSIRQDGRTFRVKLNYRF